MKYIANFSILIFLVSVSAIVDLKRQQNLAKKYADQELIQIISKDTTLVDWGLPSSLLGSKPEIVDTDFTFKQWVVTFLIEDKGFVQIFVIPSNYFIIPILNFEDNFKIDHVNFERNG